jgi:hypothetical protein
MKNITKTIFAFLAVLTIACTTDDVQDRPVIEGIGSPILSAPESGSIYTLLPENMTQQAERFVWSAADYNGDVAVAYTLEMDVEGGDFAAAQVLGGTSGALQLSVTVETLNNACLALGATPYTAANFDVRVISSASGFDMMASNKVTITINPYTTENPTLAVPGNHQGWNPPSAPLLASSGFGETDFEGYVWLDGEFKFLEKNAAGGFEWGNIDYGDDGSFSGVLVEQNESNCNASTAGYYRVRANTSTLLYSTTLTTWGIIGSATAPVTGGDGWANDANMTYNSTTKKWSLIINLVGGQEIKFRANDDWAINYGDSGADGSLNEGGDNITIPTNGSYSVELDLSNPRAYTYTLTIQ